MTKSIPLIDKASNIVLNVAHLADDAVWTCPDNMIMGPVGGDIGDRWDGAAYVRPAPPASTSIELAAHAAAKRYAVEVGGVSIVGMIMPTDRDTQAKLTAAFLLAQVNPTTTFSWKTAAGFVTLTTAQIAQIAVAVGAFVQSAYAAEATVAASIASGAITTTAQIDAAAWPKNV